MNLMKICNDLESKFKEVFSEELSFGLSKREDSRAFGAMVEQKTADAWDWICLELGYAPKDRPGKRTIYDFAFELEGKFFGIDIKTKDLDSERYSDGGICAISNLLKFLANDEGVFLIAEFGHRKLPNNNDNRGLVYISIIPFILFPYSIYRIENLGTGQIRFNSAFNKVWLDIDWDRDINDFYDEFILIATEHYKRVQGDALDRIKDLEVFRYNGYKNFSFTKRKRE